MAYNFKDFDTRTAEVVSWLEKEFSSIRTGQASPLLLDSVHVDAYGVKTPMNQVGNVGIEDARTLKVSVWDQSLASEVEQAIIDADLGVSVVSDAGGIRVVFPELTGERRAQLLKLAKTKHEDARVSLRGARDEAVKDIEAEELSEDETFAAKEELQKKMDAANNSLNDILARKEKEIST